MAQPIFHLAEPSDWAGSASEYRTASLDEEGFIHCATAAQLDGVAHRFFPDHNDLVLLTIDPDSLDDAVLVYEDSHGDGEEFPHVYGALPHGAVIGTGPYLRHLEEGLWSDPDDHWLDRMLHPQFRGVDGDGAIFDREAPGVFGAGLPVERYRLELIDEDVALVDYICEGGPTNPSRRVSVWVNTNDGWRLRFHQATPAAE